MPDAIPIEPQLNVTAFKDFESASQAVLEYLQDRFGFALWMTTRTNEPHWIVLQSSDRAYGVTRGAVFRWADSFCSRMVQGLGPQIAVNAAEDFEVRKQWAEAAKARALAATAFEEAGGQIEAERQRDCAARNSREERC